MTHRLPRLAWVLDTNVALDWLIFADPRVARLARAIEERRLCLLTRADCRDELRRVLAAADLPATGPQRTLALARYDAASELYDGASSGVLLPRCTDPSDQKFLELARDAGARWLVTKDRALLRLARRTRALGLFGIIDAVGADRLVDEAVPL